MDRLRTPQQNPERIARRAMLWLAALINYLPDGLHLPAFVQSFLMRRLDRLTGFVVYLVMQRAAATLPAPRRRDALAAYRAEMRPDIRRKIVHSRRAALGGKLRRALCVRGSRTDLKARAKSLLCALRNLYRFSASLRRRLRNGLSRRFSAHSCIRDASPLLRPGDFAGLTACAEACAARAPPC